MSEATTQATAADRCGICHTALTAAEPITACPACRTRFHEVCWQENGGCAIYGCPQVPPTQKWEDVEIPFAFWGNESKPCPSCGQQIQAAATRCRCCGALFASATPQNAREYHQNKAVSERLPGVSAGVVWLFALALFTCSAPVAGTIALVWRTTRKEELRALPALYNALLNLAVWVGLGQTGFVLLFIIIMAIVRAATGSGAE